MVYRPMYVVMRKKFSLQNGSWLLGAVSTIKSEIEAASVVTLMLFVMRYRMVRDDDDVDKHNDDDVLV